MGWPRVADLLGAAGFGNGRASEEQLLGSVDTADRTVFLSEIAQQEYPSRVPNYAEYSENGDWNRAVAEPQGEGSESSSPDVTSPPSEVQAERSGDGEMGLSDGFWRSLGHLLIALK